jgi:hypothetical protein
VSVGDDGYLTNSITTNWDWSNDGILLLTKRERRLRERKMGLRSVSPDSFDGDLLLEEDSLVSSCHGGLSDHFYLH